jgi:hypothetical protein
MTSLLYADEEEKGFAVARVSGGWLVVHTARAHDSSCSCQLQLFADYCEYMGGLIHDSFSLCT